MNNLALDKSIESSDFRELGIDEIEKVSGGDVVDSISDFSTGTTMIATAGIGALRFGIPGAIIGAGAGYVLSEYIFPAIADYLYQYEAN